MEPADQPKGYFFSQENESNILPPVESNQMVVSGLWRRIFAFVVDTTIIALFGFAISLLIFDFLAGLGGWGRLVGFIVAGAYFGFFDSRLGKGQSVGKRLMKIRVVNCAGDLISPGYSFLRYTIIAIPFFLNGILLPPKILNSSIIYPVGFLVFGVGGAIIYLFLFNRRTRQSLHDLVTGTFVLKTISTQPPSVSIWLYHWGMVGIWFVVVIIFSVVMQGLVQKNLFSKLLKVQNSIYSLGLFHTTMASTGKGWVVFNGKKSETSYFNSMGILKEKPVNNELVVHQIASITFKEYPEINDLDVLTVTVLYGFDIGIAKSWRQHVERYSPSEWKQILNRK